MRLYQQAARRCLLLATLLPAWAPAAVHQYHLTIDPGLSQVRVEARLGSGSWLQARNGRVASVQNPVSCEGQRLPIRDQQIVVPPGVRCVRYGHPLRAGGRDARNPEVAPGAVVASPGRWLWLPPRAEQDGVRITLALPPDAVASVPWERTADAGYELRPSPGSSRAVAVFGKFRSHDLAIPGARLRVALVDGPRDALGSAANEQKLLSWLEAAARDVAGVSGAFPNPAPQVIVQPGPGSGWAGGRSPVPFGYVIRDGGETVRFFVDRHRALSEFLHDWTATHEFSHLLLPYIRSEEKWISEGFASYYQNVLLARRGVYSEREVWERLHRSFRRAADIADPPALRDIDGRPFWEVRLLIYWSGAAMALLADTELRHSSDGRESLDSVLGRLRECCLRSPRAWRGAELFAKLDELGTGAIFSELFETHMSQRGMPDMTALYGELGIVVQPGSDSVVLNDGAPLAAVRRAIMDSN